MIIIAGTLRVDPADRDAYLAVVAEAIALARNAAGCLDFAQSPDPADAGRINILERWETRIWTRSAHCLVAERCRRS